MPEIQTFPKPESDYNIKKIDIKNSIACLNQISEKHNCRYLNT